MVINNKGLKNSRSYDLHSNIPSVFLVPICLTYGAFSYLIRTPSHIYVYSCIHTFVRTCVVYMPLVQLVLQARGVLWNVHQRLLGMRARKAGN